MGKAPLRSLRRHPIARLIAGIVSGTVSLAPCASLAVDDEGAAEVRPALATLPELTRNQLALAHYLDAVCQPGGIVPSGAPLATACDGLRDPNTSDDQARVALDALAPGALIDAANMALERAVLQSKSVMQRIAALRNGANGVDFANLSLQIGDQQLSGDSMNAVSKPIVGRVVDGVLNGGDDAHRFGMFANGNVRTGKRSGQNQARDAIDLTTGIDYRLRNDLAFGAAAAYAHDPSNGPVEIESWRGSIFGTYFQRDRFHVDGLVTYGTSDIDTTRTLNAIDALQADAATARAATTGRQLAGELTTAFDLKQGPWAFGPRIGAYYLDVDVDRLDETGAGPFDLSVGSQNAQSLRVAAGARLGLAVQLPWGVVTPNVNADFVHDVQDRSGSVDVRLANDLFGAGVRPAVLQMESSDSGYFVWSVGATAQLAQAISAFVTYRTFEGADSAASELTWGLRFKATP